MIVLNEIYLAELKMSNACAKSLLFSQFYANNRFIGLCWHKQVSSFAVTFIQTHDATRCSKYDPQAKKKWMKLCNNFDNN